METVTRKDFGWLRIAGFAAGIFSTCAKRQYFAIVLDKNGRVVGTGYNGSPPGMIHCNDGGCPRLQENSAPGSSYSNCIAIHAEANALVWSDRTMRLGGTLVINGTPCWDCGKILAGSGLKRVVYVRDESYADLERVEQMLELAGIDAVGVNFEDLS